jgi:hypothetical protein
MIAISGTGWQDTVTSAQIHPTACHIAAPRRYLLSARPSAAMDFQAAFRLSDP